MTHDQLVDLAHDPNVLLLLGSVTVAITWFGLELIDKVRRWLS